MTPVFGRVIFTTRHETHTVTQKKQNTKKKGKTVQWPQRGAFALGCSKEPDKPARLGGSPDTRGQKHLALVPLAPLTTLVLTLKTFQVYEK